MWTNKYNVNGQYMDSFELPLFLNAIEHGGDVVFSYPTLNLNGANREELEACLSGYGLRHVCTTHKSEYWVGPSGVVILSREGFSRLLCNQSLQDAILAVVPKVSNIGKIHVLKASGGGVSIKPISVNVSRELVESNYEQEVVTRFQEASAVLCDKDPFGRLLILDGPPGSGKTHLIRALLMREKVSFVLIPASMVAMIQSAEFVGVLESFLEDRELEARSFPVVLAVEDGDACLVPRMGDNISAISSVLNMTDGLMGAAYDLRMVVTTNAKVKDVDPAILRPGRLIDRIHVGELTAKQASAVIRRETGDASAAASGPMVLADAYEAVYGRKADRISKKRVGFTLAESDV